MVRRILLAIAFVAAFAQVHLGSAFAQCGTTIPPGLNRGVCVYSVKFVCGFQQGNPAFAPPLEPPVKPGNYATAVNIHNFHNGQSVPIAKKAVIASPENQEPGQIGQFRKLTLGPDQALEIDCPDIVSLLGGTATAPLPPFIKGFVEVVSPLPLSVTGVYTAQGCTPQTPGAPCEPSGPLGPSGPVSIEVVPQTAFVGP